mmetsp:Transcript_29591/g.36565  ORF Transcript_29591/g.36565 Transcript_29591/m.36565 type:complete len:237 (-) Transcript_29591:1194-1904(-)
MISTRCKSEVIQMDCQKQNEKEETNQVHIGIETTSREESIRRAFARLREMRRKSRANKVLSKEASARRGQCQKHNTEDKAKHREVLRRSFREFRNLQRRKLKLRQRTEFQSQPQQCQFWPKFAFPPAPEVAENIENDDENDRDSVERAENETNENKKRSVKTMNVEQHKTHNANAWVSPVCNSVDELSTLLSRLGADSDNNGSISSGHSNSNRGFGKLRRARMGRKFRNRMDLQLY